MSTPVAPVATARPSTIQPDEHDLLTADFFHAVKGRWSIEVGWLPERDPSGAFHCRLRLDGQEPPVELVRTADPERMFRWAQRVMQFVVVRA